VNRLRAGPVISVIAVAALLLGGVAVLSLSVSAQEVGNAHKTAQKKAGPRKFGFTVVDVEVEKCCSDVPGRPTPTGLIYITGHDPGGWRFSLSCSPSTTYFVEFRGNLNELAPSLTDKQKKYWRDVAVASFESVKSDQSKMRLWTFGEKAGAWQEVGSCFVNGSIDNAKDTFGVYVTSSTYLPKNGEYILTATTTGVTADGGRRQNMETFTMECSEDVQRPCVSVAPKVMWAVRNGSWIRLCDGDFKLIGTYRITSELP